MERPDWSEVLDHLGLVSGMFEELGIGEVMDQATQQNPELRIVTAGYAVKAMVLNGLGFVPQQLSLVPHCFHHKPTDRLLAPWIAPEHLNDEALGRALDTLYAYGVTELYRWIAATAAQRWGLAPTVAHLDSTSFHVDGRYHCDEEPDEHVIPITRGYSRDHRPDLNQGMLDVIVEHQAGLPVLRQPLSGNSRDAQDFGQLISAPIAQLQIPYGTTYLVADRALDSANNLQRLAQTDATWITRVPATGNAAQAALAQADLQTMAPLIEGYRYQSLTSTYGGVEQRWLLIHSEPRRAQAQRTAAKQLRKHSAQDLKAFKTLCRTGFACEADAQQALSTFTQGLQATFLAQSPVSPTPRYGKRGRPGPGVPPEQRGSQIEGALASRVAAYQARVAQQSCFILATNELDVTRLSPQEILAGYKGQVYAARGFRFLKDPHLLAASL